MTTATSDLTGPEDDAPESWRRLEAPRGDFTRPRGMLAYFAHDFLQPLTALRLGLSEVEEALSVEHGEAYDAFRDIEAAYGQIAELVKALEDADKLDSQDLQAKHAWVDVSGLVSEVVRSFRPTARARRTRVEAQLPARRAFALTDRQLLMRLVSNLVDNGIRHGGADGCVRVSVQVEGDLLRLGVEDEGPGLPRSLVVTPTGTPRGRGGVGLGLLMCARVATLLSGHLSVGPGPGGRFRFEIPGSAKLR